MIQEEKMKVRGTDFVLYQVTDLDRSIAFYRDTLGMKLEFRVEAFPWAEFTATPTTLALSQPAEMSPEQTGGGVSIVLAVDNVVESIKELKEKGVTIVLEAMETPVCWMACIADPDGNVIGLHQRKDGTFG
jgi:predicted enzyme related to lactoylglutathione lyase